MLTLHKWVFCTRRAYEMSIEIVTWNWNSLFEKFELHKKISSQLKTTFRTDLQNFNTKK